MPPEKVGLQATDHWFHSADGTKLNAWLVTEPKKNEASKGLIILFHGNAQNLSSHYLNLYWAIKAGYDVFAFDYRGYGRSEGKPTPEGLIQDGEKAITYAVEKIWPDVVKANKSAKLVVYGQSLGGMVAPNSVIQSPFKNKIHALILEATFASYRHIAKLKMQSQWPTWIFWPIAYSIVHEGTASKYILPKLDYPNVLVIHGTDDEVVPVILGKEVFNLLPAGNKKWWPVSGKRHLLAIHDSKEMQTQLLGYLAELK
jgi:alpha-beta hydrolase superfamily lysophospholipase